MTRPTVAFPDSNTFRAGIESPVSRTAYLRGLAYVDDYTSEWDEGRLTPRLLEAGLLAVPSFLETTQLAGPLGNGLIDCALSSSRLKLSGHGNRDINYLAELAHLRYSIRERVLDLFECARLWKTASARDGYDAKALTLAATSRDVTRMGRCGFPSSVIRGTLEISRAEFRAATLAEPAPTLYSSNLPRYSRVVRSAYSHTNSKGVTYYLHSTEVTLRGGKPQRIYFFAKVENNAKGQPVALPDDRVVKENPRNGFLTVSKKK